MVGVIHPDSICKLHVGVFIKVWKVSQQVFVIVVQICYVVALSADGVEYLRERIALCAVGEHSTDRRHAHGRENHVFAILVRVHASKKVQRELVLLLVDNLFFLGQRECLHRSGAAFTAYKHRCQEG